MATPTDQEQLYLELINDARLDPLGNAARFITSYSPLLSDNPNVQNSFDYFGVLGADLLSALSALTPVGPLAWNDDLATAAQKHSAEMIAADSQSHQLPGEAALGARITAEGYDWIAIAENIFTYAEDVLSGHAAFYVDWGFDDGDDTNGDFASTGDGVQDPPGHRQNILSANYTEVGIDVTAESDASTEVGPFVVTQDFGARAGMHFILGVAYTDSDGDNFYSIGEGRADLSVTVGEDTTTTSASGGYSLSTGTGSISATLSGGGLSGPVTVGATIDVKNIKLDVVDGDTLLSSGSVVVDGPIGTLRALGVIGVSLTAGSGNQLVEGNAGDDTLDGGPGDDTIDGGDGDDTAVFSGNRSDYAVTEEDGGFRLVDQRGGANDGSDLARNIEDFEFADGMVAAADLLLDSPNNQPPTASPETILATEDNPIITGQLDATDPDGDDLTFSPILTAQFAPGVAGLVINADGSYSFDPSDPHYQSLADGEVGEFLGGYFVSDGSETDDATITITVTGVNDTPVFQPSVLEFLATFESPTNFAASATDIDGDSLTYMAADPAHGVVSGGAGGQFVFTPDDGFFGTDSIIVTVSDGKGGSAMLGLVVTVGPPAPDEWTLLTSTGFVGSIGGSGVVFGTSGFQDIRVLDEHGSVSLDGSFNKGGDIVRLAGNAGDWQVVLSGSSAIFSDGDTFVQVPAGVAGLAIVFDDGVRTLAIDTVASALKIGSQAISEELAQITAPSDGAVLPSGANGDATAQLLLASGASVTAAGNLIIFGTAASETVHLITGDAILDGSFNKGGDTLILNGSATTFTANQESSAVFLNSSNMDVLIPVGVVGMTLEFAGNDERALLIDTDIQSIVIGSQEIGIDPVALAGIA